MNEPNNTPDNYGRLFGERDVVVCPGDRDIFGVVAQAGQSVVFDLSFDHAFGDLDLTLYTASGELLGRSDSATNGESLTVNFLQNATLILEVAGFRASNSGTQRQIVPTATLCFEDGFLPYGE